jgi:hypothetical protein
LKSASTSGWGQEETPAPQQAHIGYSITSSAMASTPGGTSIPSARGLQVDRQLELGRLQNRKVGGLLALENAADVAPNLTVGGRSHESWAVAALSWN